MIDLVLKVEGRVIRTISVKPIVAERILRDGLSYKYHSANYYVLPDDSPYKFSDGVLIEKPRKPEKVKKEKIKKEEE